MTTSERIRAALVEADVTQAQVARFLGITQPAISRRLAVDFAWRVDDVQAIAALVDVDVLQLIEG